MEPTLTEPRTNGRAAMTGGASMVAECVDPRHPTLQGRLRVRWTSGTGEEHERWVPSLQGLPVREGDRLLLVAVENRDEPIAVGVVDGFARRPHPERREKAAVELERDECLRVRARDGQSLVEIHQSEDGPVVRLLQDSVEVELPGDLRLSADDIALQARQGRVSVRATDDVVLEGETVRLN
ncbi:MAG: hypothetical protein ACOC5J_01730 [Gemmatimonadota bacterium]